MRPLSIRLGIMAMLYKSARWCVALLLGSVTFSAQATRAADDFESKVRPILVEKCQSCHGPDKQRAGLRLDSKQGWQTGGENGPAIVPGKPEASLFIKALRATDGVKQMPPKDKLSEREIAILTKWVKDGAADPRDGGPPRLGGMTVDDAKKWWSFQPVKPQTVPASTYTHPIDAFLADKLKPHHQTLAPRADKRTLLRRVTFDLTGLPPTPQEMEQFVQDNSPDAFAKVVDRLLASPRYGERWGRHWLDIARFADSNGMDENLAYVNAWRYRDWVIRSFNNDLPYNEFIRDQIAGDLIPGGTEAQRADRLTATGFFVVGPKMLAEDDPVKMQMDIIDEQLDTIGQSIMGMTFGCARCHDHKFDPITAADYYSLAGILYSTKTMKNFQVVAAWNERAIGSPEATKLLAEHDQKVKEAKTALTDAEKTLRSAAAKRLTQERSRAAEYAKIAADIATRGSDSKLVLANPSGKLPEGSTRVQSENYTRGNVLKLTDSYGEGIGVIINAGPTPNFAEYDIDIAKAGKYQLAVRYAALESRPVRILVDGRTLANEACGLQTGGWNPDSQRWVAELNLTLKPGKVVIRFERDGAIPHLDQFVLIPMTAEQQTKASLNVNDAAAEHKLLPSVLREWVRVMKERKGVVPNAEDLAKIVDTRNGPFQNKPDVQADIEPKQAKQVAELRAKLTAIENKRPPIDEVMAVEEGKVQNLRIHLRGSHLTLGVEVPRRFPQILSASTPISIDASKSGRLELANWLVSPQHPLTARVMVNRIWAGHFGTGIVRSMDNFGRLGDQPSHPELLDWLAMEFQKRNWSIKQMHKLIVTSQAYQMGSQHDAAFTNTDPENKLLSHFPRRRLEAEEIRDGMLAISGLLDLKMGGTLLKATPRQYVNSTGSRRYDGYAVPRRSIYLPVVRSGVFDVLQTLDFPDPSVSNGQRVATTTPSQALLMMNSELVDQTSDAMAKTLLEIKGDDAARIREAYLRILGRAPTHSELIRIQSYLKQSEDTVTNTPTPDAKRLAVWRGLCRVLFASNEFVFVE